MIRNYNKKYDGNIKLSDSFRVREFACKDGSDTVIIDDKLVSYLQRIRNWAGASVIISSGYRTEAYNAKIGGAAHSKHTLGMAADIYVERRQKNIYEIAKYAEAIGLLGIERNEDSNYVHVDTRENKYFWYRKNKTDHTVNTFGGRCQHKEPTHSLKRGSTGDGVKWLQFWLRLWGYDVAVDGNYGAHTESAVMYVQRRRGLTEDGIAGAQTRKALKGY